MKLINVKNRLLITIILLLLFQISFAQSENDKWVFGIGMNAVDYFPLNNPGSGNTEGFLNEVANFKDHWNFGAPKIHVTRHLWNRISLEGAFSYNVLTLFGDTKTEKTSYTSFDLNAQYAFLDPDEKFNAAVSLGGSFVSAYSSGTFLNVGGNLNYWFSENFGLNVQGMVKYNFPDHEIESHMFYALSIVYRPSGKGFGSGQNFRWRNGR